MIKAFKDTQATCKVMLVINDDDNSYDDILPNLPPNFNAMFTKVRGCARAQEHAFQTYPNEPWYAPMGDDSIPETKGWDKVLPERAIAMNGMAWCQDGESYEHHAGLPFIDGEIVRKVGFFVPEGIYHYGMDSFWFLLCEGHREYHKEFMIRHYAEHLGGPNDETRRENRLYTHQDSLAWKNVYWKIPYIRAQVWPIKQTKK